MIRRYDQAIRDLLALTIDANKIRMSFASASHEGGTETERRVERAAPNSESVGLPAMALTRLGWELNPERQNLRRHRHLGWSDDLDMVFQAQHPMAWDIAYQLDIETRYREDMNILTQFTIIKFPNIVRAVLVDLGPPWGIKKVYLKLGNVVDNTEFQGDENKIRTYKTSIDFMFEAWMTLPPVSVRTVRKLIAQVRLDWVDDKRGIDVPVLFEKVLSEG